MRRRIYVDGKPAIGPSPAVRSAAAQRSADRKRAVRAAEAAVRRTA